MAASAGSKPSVPRAADVRSRTPCARLHAPCDLTTQSNASLCVRARSEPSRLDRM